MSEDTLTGTLTAVYAITTLAPKKEPSEKSAQAYELSRLLNEPEFEQQVRALMEQIPRMPGTAQTLYHVLNKKMDAIITSPTKLVRQAYSIRRGKNFRDYE